MGADGYILSGVFGQTLARYGLIAAVAVVIGFAVVGVLAYYLKTRIEIMRQEADAQGRERQEEFAARSRERAALVAELSQQRVLVQDAQSKLYTFMNNHLEHDRVERETLGEVLKDISQTQQATAASVNEHLTQFREHRKEDTAHAGKTFEKLEDLHRDVLRAQGGA